MHMSFPLIPKLTRGLSVWMLSLTCFASSAQADRGIPIPAEVGAAPSLAALPGGLWLAQDKQALRLLDQRGTLRASLTLRSDQLDVRAVDARHVLAVVIDRNTQRPLPLLVDTVEAKLQALPELPVDDPAPETLCLYRDDQQLIHLFTVAADGQAQQWLWHDGTARLLRRLALPPDVAQCRVDDHAAELFVSEPAYGVWSYAVTTDAPMARKLVSLPPRAGHIDSAEAMAVVPGGVAAVMAGRQGLRHLPGGKAIDTAGRAVALGMNAREADMLLVRGQGEHPWRAYDMGRVGPRPSKRPVLPFVLPEGQTVPVQSHGDAADDPAIWVHPGDRTQSLVLGTNKKQGLEVYDLDGRQRQSLQVGRLNNVDVRQRVRWGDHVMDLAVASHRDKRTIVVFGIDAAGVVAEHSHIQTTLDDLYGICLYQPSEGGLSVVVNDKDGRFEQYVLSLVDGRVTGHLARSFRLSSQPEGCVADDRHGRLFVGEEDRGVWVLSADPLSPAQPRMILPVGPVLHDDVEGMAIFHGTGSSYLIISSQGSNSYVVMDANPPYRVRGSFRVGINAQAGIDGTSETDGLDVTSANLGGPYAQGMLVVQDGFKRLPDGPQNFKFVPWSAVAEALKLAP